MRYQGSEAVNAAYERRQQERAARPSLEVVTGGGLDARARRGVAPEFLARVRAVVAVAMVLVALGAARVTLSAATVTLLTGNIQTKASIEQAQALNDDLRVERSVLSSVTRIGRIATQNYGMVSATSHDVFVIQTPEEIAAEEAAAAEAAEAEAAVAAEAEAAAEEGAQMESLDAKAPLDGDAVAEAGEADVADPMA